MDAVLQRHDGFRFLTTDEHRYTQIIFMPYLCSSVFIGGFFKTPRRHEATKK
jgi:hypothetical protein